MQDFGADPNGVEDSADAIQRCFDEAFGPADAPHGNGGGPKNSPVYIPRGNYKCLKPLVLTAVWGGRIFGDGMLCSNISYAGPLQPVTAEGWIPTLWFNGFNFSELENLSFTGPADSNKKTACLWFGPDGTVSSSAHGNLIKQCSTGGQASYGIIHGSAGSAANSENTYLNCTLFGIHDIGLFLSGGNTLNFRFIGGSIDSCKTGIATNNSATCPLIENVAFCNNKLDIDLEASGRTVISGIRSESNQLLRTNAAVTLLNCHASAPGADIRGSMSGNVLTVRSVSRAVLFPGNMIVGAGLPALYNSQVSGKGITQIVKQLSGSTGGVGTYELTQHASFAETDLRSVPVFAEIVGAGSISMDSCGGDCNQAILGDNNSVLSIRNNQWFTGQYGAMAPDLIRAFNGQILAYDIAGRGEFIVAHLPHPNRALRGVRMFVHDATAINFGEAVVGGGSKTAPIWCDGGFWRIG